MKTLVALAVLGMSAIPAAAQTVIVPAPMSDDGVRYTQADAEGRYVFQPTAGAEALTLDRDGFIAWMRAQQADRTIRDRQGAHGWLAEYSAADGRTWLWYPGNKAVVEGRWKIEARPARLKGKAISVVEICFTYPGAYNAVEGKPGDRWDCWPAFEEVSDPEGLERRGREVRAGDVFNLSSGTIPHVLTRETRPAWPTEAHQ